MKWVAAAICGALILACSQPTVEPAPTVTVTKTVQVPRFAVEQRQFDKGWRTGVHYACNTLYGGPVEFGHWRYEVDPYNGDVIGHKALVWVILGANYPNEQPMPVTYRMCIRMAKHGPPSGP